MKKARCLLWMVILLLLAPLQAHALKTTTESAETSHKLGLNGFWIDPEGGLFVVRHQGNRFKWMGEGLNDKKIFFHRGIGAIEGNTLNGEWMDNPDSEFYPSEGKITGTLSDDRQKIRWQDNQGFYREWVRQMASASTSTQPVTALQADGGKPSGAASGGWDSMAQALQADGNAATVGQVGQQGKPVADETSGTGWGAMANALQQQGIAPHQPIAKPVEPVPDSMVPPNTHLFYSMSGGDISEALNKPDSWKDLRIQQLIDQWLANALPEHVRQDSTARYEKWGRITGRGITMAGRPDINEERHQYLWRNAAKFPSLNLCTMRVYVERNLKEQSLADCAREIPPASSPPPLNPDEDFSRQYASPAVSCAGQAGQVRVLANARYLGNSPQFNNKPVIAAFIGGIDSGGIATEDEEWRPYLGRVDFVTLIPGSLANELDALSIEEFSQQFGGVYFAVDDGQIHQALFGHTRSNAYPHFAVFDGAGRLIEDIEAFDGSDTGRAIDAVDRALNGNTCQENRNYKK